MLSRKNYLRVLKISYILLFIRPILTIFYITSISGMDLNKALEENATFAITFTINFLLVFCGLYVFRLSKLEEKKEMSRKRALVILVLFLINMIILQDFVFIIAGFLLLFLRYKSEGKRSEKLVLSDFILPVIIIVISILIALSKMRIN